MIKSHLELYLNGQWKTYHTYNQMVFDERRDGQIKSAMCYIVTQEKTRFKPMRKAKLVIQDETTTKTFYYFAYFKSQKRGPNYWWHEVTLIDVAKRVQGQMIDGLRVVQDTNNSVTLYDTFKRLCDTTPLRLTTQSNLYNPTTDSTIVSLMQSIRSPEYAWSCRTLMWECLKEIGMDMGGYFPSVEFGDNGQYILTFFPTDEITQTINGLDYISIAEGVDASQVCSEIDTDIANIIATNQGTASIVFPAQNGWITPRTDDVQLTSDNCEIQTPNTIEKVLHVYLNINGIEADGSKPGGASTGQIRPLTEILGGRTILEITDYVPEYKKYQSLERLNRATYDKYNITPCWNNTIYWEENSNKIVVCSLVTSTVTVGNRGNIDLMLQAAVLSQFSANDPKDRSKLDIDGQEAHLFDVHAGMDPRPLQFRVEYIPRDTSTKLRSVKQEKCDYEYVLPYNQRAEIVDAPSLGQELDKSVNQMGVNYIKTVNRYNALSDILPIGTAYVEGADTYILTVNEYEQTSHENITVTHTFSKNWSMLSEYLKQNKQYRNTRIPTDILARNLHYQDYFLISETNGLTIHLGEKGILTLEGVRRVADVFNGGRVNQNSEVNNLGFYRKLPTSGQYRDGVMVSCASFAVKKSIVLSGKMQNNLTAGKKVDPDNEYYCQDVLYTDESGTLGAQGTAYMIFGIMDSNISPNDLPQSNRIFDSNLISNPVVKAEFFVDKFSAEQIGMTYQIHFVSDMPDIVIGGMIAENNPLIQDRTEELKYQLWGLTSPLPKTSVVVNEYGIKIADIDATNRSEYFVAEGSESGEGDALNILLSLYLLNKMSEDYIGWAITDEKGRLYLARNSHPNVNQNLFINHLHKYHEQD